MHKLFELPLIFYIGAIIIVGFFVGKIANKCKFPSIVGYMLVGILFGPSCLNIISEENIVNLHFISEIILGFVAVSIGLELNFSHVKKEGNGIILSIFTESFGAFIAVFISLYLLTKNVPLALLFAAIAPASAPAGTVAVIKEYKAKGKLTKALYTVVGFDDALGIMIFGVSAAIAKFLIIHNVDGAKSFLSLSVLLLPIKEISLSILLGVIFSLLFIAVTKVIKQSQLNIFILGFILAIIGICQKTHLSLILANMVLGLVITNFCKNKLIKRLDKEIYFTMPLFFILFFSLAGTNLHIGLLPQLGLVGIVYILFRSVGLILGASVGAYWGKLSPNIQKYLGLGILSQAGVAIGLSLIVKHDLKSIGKVVDPVQNITEGDYIGSIILTTITATCLFFEIIGPILTKIALEKSGEIKRFKKEKAITSSVGLLQKRKVKLFKNILKIHN